MSTTATEIPGYLAGTWTIDPVHSDVSFSVRHMMISKVRGRFGTFEGEITTSPDPLASSVTARIDVSSLDTGNEQRDGHIRSGDFLGVETYPTMTYVSRTVRQEGSRYQVEGDLTLHGITRPVPLRLEVNGFGPDGYGGTRAGFSASAQISRRDFGIDLSMPMDGGGVVVGDAIDITLEIEAVLQTPGAATA